MFQFNMFLTGVLGLIVTYSMPGDQIILAGFSGFVAGYGGMGVVINCVLNR